MRKIKMFATHNDTDKYAVCVDGYFGLFDTEAEAKRVWDMIGGTSGSDGLADTAFGSASFLRPGHVVKFYDESEPDGGFDRISDHQPIDIKGYIVKTPLRLEHKVLINRGTTKERLQFKRFFGDMFGNIAY